MISTITHIQQGTLYNKGITSSLKEATSLKVGYAAQKCSSKLRDTTGKLWSNQRSSRGSVVITKCSGSSSSNDTVNDSSAQNKASFGNSRKDVILIGVGVTVFGWALKSGLEFVGVDPLQAGNVVQLIVVLGMTIGWISTYMFRVASKDMTYAKQLRDYEYKVMEKRLEGLTEAEVQALIEQVEEEKRRLANRKQIN